MAFKLIFAALAAVSLAASSGAYQLPRSDQLQPLNPPIDNLIPLSAYIDGLLTNAERMKRGMGPARPSKFSDGSVTRREPSSTPTSPSNPEPTDVPTTTPGSGVIRIHDPSSSSTTLYWVSKDLNNFGEYGRTDDISKALTVTLGSDSGTFSIRTPSPACGCVSDLPFLGGIMGFATSGGDLKSSSADYAYLGATVETANGSPAVSGDNSFTRATGISKSIESSIWSISSDNSLTATWINADGAMVDAHILYYAADNVLSLTADPVSFVNNFGASPAVELILEAI
ncbi:hypothetical protein DFP72DRAFT_896588 [Ephemerocybe angulata]|uniref:Uncharacterized protein n=1 Tax=Ephemerocybe angulata TaxID=980116 RepID=A0A8H6I0V8_9AGAR|nr:hypothetical protein DFP72DRAFT_896588 [Tulosesus angulatus]